VELELTSTNDEEFERDGFTIVKGAYTAKECDEFVAFMMDLQAGKTSVEGYSPDGPEDWERLICRNCHNPVSLAWMLDPRLRAPLRRYLGDEPDGIQSMYFFKGTQQGRHQDSFFLPGCMSAWVALQEVGPFNGSVCIQVGSHKKPQIKKEDFLEGGEWFGYDWDGAHDALFERNGLPEIAIEAEKGDMVFFDGGLIHRGGPVTEPGSFRHSWAGHYIPHSFDPWPYESAPRMRVTFDGHARFSPTE
jgi:hypothetical protein